MNRNNRLIHILILTMLILILPTAQASAMLTRCRLDPIFVLSNGDKVTITLDIGTDAANISKITYILHVPFGVTVTKAVFTAGGIAGETYQVYQDSAAKTYTTDSLVMTANKESVVVIAKTRVNGATEETFSGYSGQHLIITVSKQ